MIINQTAIGGGFWLAAAPAATFVPLQNALRGAFGFSIVLSTVTIKGKFYYSGAGRTAAEQAVINPGQVKSDHVLGQAIDVNNDPTFRKDNEAMFLEIMAEHHWHNIQVNGAPFTSEPWHFAWRGTNPAVNGSTNIPVPKPEEDDMPIVKLSNTEVPGTFAVFTGFPAPTRLLLGNNGASQLRAINKINAVLTAYKNGTDTSDLTANLSSEEFGWFLALKSA